MLIELYIIHQMLSELFNYLDKEEVKYISVLDDDDSLSPEFYSRLISVIVNKKFAILQKL